MNRTTRLAAAALLAAMMTTSLAYAEQTSPPSEGSGQAVQVDMDPQAVANRKAEEELALKNRKAEMLLRLDHHIADLQRKKNCVESATTREALHDCNPAGKPGAEPPKGQPQ